ncbi:hypothetical protein CRG98_047279 [Punica granatum]|uniref:Uncharacterized protein n=1 Tax=Punica granatum TaxID=22663 RepID=A0A2I0HKS6_PUNGR|nr:hypothetical protein CRG98_047279 [Punica granatum]
MQRKGLAVEEAAELDARWGGGEGPTDLEVLVGVERLRRSTRVVKEVGKGGFLVGDKGGLGVG